MLECHCICYKALTWKFCIRFRWCVLDSEFLQIAIPGEKTEKYKFTINGNFAILKNVLTPSKELILEKY